MDHRSRRFVAGIVLAYGLISSSAAAQEAPSTAPAALAEAAAQAGGAGASEPGVATRFVVDVAHDYKNFLSFETAWWLAGGGAAALGIHQADQSLAESAQANPHSMPGGSLYGTQLVQIPVALGWWIAGSAAGSSKQASVGRDLLRAQLLAGGWTYAIKFATDRTRPNGDPRSLPSGHASTSFAIGMVLQEHFGWKVGLPAFLAAAYTGVSRVADNQHWASDVVFGAAVGAASGRTVTIHLRDKNVSLAPVPIPGGIGVAVVGTR